MINRVIIMRHFTEKALNSTKTAAVIGAFLFCIMNVAEVSEAVSDAVMRCIDIIIPSLFAMMIVSGLLVKSGITGAVPKLIGRISEKLLGIEGFILPVFTFGMFAGYPVGAKVICSETESGRLEKKRAALLCGICYGAGPAFIFGCISDRLYSSRTAGLIVLVSNTAANIIVTLLLVPLLKKTLRRNNVRRSFCLSADMATRSVLGAGHAMAEICMMTAAFSVFTVMLESLGVISFAGSAVSRIFKIDYDTSGIIVRSLLDVTAASELPCGNYTLLPLISSLTSFGGLCVIMQISAITSGKISIKPLILIRLAASAVSFAVCRVIMPFMLKNEIVSAAAIKTELHQSRSPVPSVMLILMTFVIFLEQHDFSEKIRSRR